MELKYIMYYIIKNYPNQLKQELSNARLTKTVYLADWKQAIIKHRQISDIKWYFDNYGPFVNDIKHEAEKYPEIFKIKNTMNMYGQPKTYFEIIDNSEINKLLLQINNEDKEIMDFIIDITSKMYWDDFIKLVYSTYPITSSERYTYLNLIEKAEEYQQFNETFKNTEN